MKKKIMYNKSKSQNSKILYFSKNAITKKQPLQLKGDNDFIVTEDCIDM